MIARTGELRICSLSAIVYSISTNIFSYYRSEGYLSPHNEKEKLVDVAYVVRHHRGSSLRKFQYQIYSQMNHDTVIVLMHQNQQSLSFLR